MADNQKVLPQFIVPPAGFFTGEDLRNDARTLNGMVEALSYVVDATSDREDRLGTDLLMSWNSFQADWFNYFQDTYATATAFDNFLTALNNGNRDQLIQFERRFVDLHDLLKARGVDSAAADIAVSLGSPGAVTALIGQLDAAAKKLLPFGLGLGAFLVIALVVWFLVIPRMMNHA